MSEPYLTPVELQKAFPVCRAKIFQRSEDETPDFYSVLGSGKGRITLEAPRERLQNDLPRAGQTIFVQSLLADAAYKMPARVVECLDGNTVKVILEQVGQIQRIGRRRYFRVKTDMPVRLVDRSAGDAEERSLVSRDISAGGVSIISEAHIPKGHEVSLVIDLFDGLEPFNCAAEVAHCRPYGTGRYALGVAFLNVSEHDSRRLVQALLKIARTQINP